MNDKEIEHLKLSVKICGYVYWKNKFVNETRYLKVIDVRDIEEEDNQPCAIHSDGTYSLLELAEPQDYVFIYNVVSLVIK